MKKKQLEEIKRKLAITTSVMISNANCEVTPFGLHKALLEEAERLKEIFSLLCEDSRPKKDKQHD